MDPSIVAPTGRHSPERSDRCQPLAITTDAPTHAPESGTHPYEPVAVARRYPPPRCTVDPDTSKGWIRRVLPVALARPWLALFSILAALVAMGTSVVAPAVVRAAIDNALDAQTDELAPYVWMLVGLGLARAILSFFYRNGLFRLAYHIEADLRSILFGHMSRLSFSFYDRVQSGQLISRANSDIRSVQMILAFAPLMGLSILSFAFALVYMLSIHVGLTIVAVATLPIVYVVGVKLRNEVFPLSWITQARMADIATIVDENVSGVRVVKSFAAEERQISTLAAAAEKLRWSTVETAKARARYAPVMENLPRVGLALVLLYGGWLVIEGQLTVGTLVAFNAYIMLLQTPFRLLGFFLMLAQRAAASADRIYEILDEPIEIVDRPDAVALDRPEGRIRFDHVGFGYAGHDPILDGLDLEISPGETVALVGRSGSGKTTVTRLLDRFYDVTRGAITVDGHDIRDLTLPSLRHNVGMVLDEPFLFSVSVADNIAYGRPDASRSEIEAAARAAQADEFIRELEDGYDTVIGERGYTLSGGQRQRLAIARALLVNPPILVFDDATSAIDVKVEEAIHAALDGMLSDRTTILIAHRLSTIALADRVVLLEGGRAVATGTHADLMATEPRYVDVLAHVDEDEEQDQEVPV